MRQHIYLSNELRVKFVETCKRRGWKMSTVLQRLIEDLVAGKLDPFKEQESNQHGNIV